MYDIASIYEAKSVDDAIRALKEEIGRAHV